MARPTVHTEAEVRAAVEGSLSLSQALKAMGLRAAGGNFKTLNRLIEYYGIPTDHFDPSWANRGIKRHQPKKPLEEILVEHSTYERAKLKRRLYDDGLKQRKCEICGQGELWNGVHISLILDHINGVHDDNRLENLQIVCPNCNAGLDTHCGRQTRNGPRECRLCGEEFQPRYTKQTFCSQRCGSRSPANAEPRLDKRKVERPNRSELLRDLEQSNYSAVGRKYGVSDNAVRKWVRAYEYQERRAQRAAAEASGVSASDEPAHPQ